MQVFKEEGRHQNYQVILIHLIEGLGHILFSPPLTKPEGPGGPTAGNAQSLHCTQQREGLNTNLAPVRKARQIGIFYQQAHRSTQKFMKGKNVLLYQLLSYREKRNKPPLLQINKLKPKHLMNIHVFWQYSQIQHSFFPGSKGTLEHVH